MMKKILITICIILNITAIRINVKAQSQPQYFLPQPFARAPEATAQEKYGTYQVNEFHGMPDISIPLYTIEAGGLQVPVTLSYHASGNKVTDVAGWAGLGWSVSSGGQITRKTMGLPDDVIYGYLNGYKWLPANITTTTALGINYLENVANGTYDSKPDIYSYDFPGHDGKFFFDGSTAGSYIPRMMPYSPIKVDYTLVPGSHPPATGITRFDIADEHGNNYTFGDGGTEVTYSSSGGSSSGITSATAWKLETMMSQNRRDTINFTYQADHLGYPAADSEIFTVIDNVNNITGPGFYSPSYTSAPATIGNVNIVTEELPQQITFKNGKVVFDLDASPRTDLTGGGSALYGLNYIKVYQYNYGTKTMEMQKKIVFYKSYFNSTGAKRLRLDSIQVQDKAGSAVQTYRFDYNTAISLPDYSSRAQDYWGYYNGKTTNTMLTPQQTVPYINGGLTYVTIGQANRNCDSNYMQAYVLTGIHYPTGGYSTFTYQTNQYTDSGVLNLAGGLRVRSISSYDGINATPIVKTYVYNSARANFLLNNTDLFINNAYFVATQTHRYYTVEGGPTGAPHLDATESVRSYTSYPHCDLEAYDGTAVVYPSVTEYIGTPGNNIGRTDYTFSDEKDALTSASAAGTFIYLSYFYARGHLLTKNEYIHKADDTYQLARADTNTYSAFLQTTYSSVGLAVKKLNYNEGPAGVNPFEQGTALPDDENSFLRSFYDILSDDNYLTSSSTTNYDLAGVTKSVSSSVAYNYGTDVVHQQIISSIHVDSKSNTRTSTNKYAFNYFAGNAIIDGMVNNHMWADVIEKSETYQIGAAAAQTTSAQLSQFKFGTIANTIVPDKVSILNIAAPVTDFAPSTVTFSGGFFTKDSRYTQMISFDQYDNQNNIAQYTPRNSTPVTILWDYLYEYPVAQVKNAKYIVSASTQVAYTSFEAPAFGGWSYSGSTVTDPTAPTGSMVYPLSLGSVTSPAMDISKSYVVSLWSRGAAPTVTAGSSLTGTTLRTTGGWTYYEYTVPAGQSSVVISGSPNIDELRIYPTDAQMATYAYNPNGITEMADTKGSISHFDYDAFSRLKNIKDWNGYIVKNFGYHTYDQTYGNAAINPATFTRNNCPAGTTPGSTTYSVAANKYYALSQADADAKAAYDQNTNGQIKANTVCTCTIP